MHASDLFPDREPAMTRRSMSPRLAAALLACVCTLAAAQRGADTITSAKLGAVYAFSGPLAIYTTTVRNGLEMAAAEINASNGIKLDLVLEDDRSTKDDAINVYQKFIQRENALIILGPVTGGQVFAAAPLAQRAKVPVMLTSVATSGVTNIGDYVFRTSVESSAIIPATVRVAHDQMHLSRVAEITANDDQNAVGDRRAYEAAFKAVGVNLLDVETIRTGDVDYSAQLTKIRSFNPDSLIVTAQGEQAVGIITQARKLGMDKVRFLGANSFNATGVVKEAGKAMEGALSATPWFVSMPTPKNVAFVRRYREQYKSDPDWLAAQSYDAVYLIEEALLNAKIGRVDDVATARTKLRDALAAIKNFDGVLGRIQFNANRDPMVAGAVIEVRNGQHVLAGQP
jgi:branched-chain amino acid transport system substrate-binding protein